MTKPFWDQSLKTRSIPTNPRAIVQQKTVDLRYSVSPTHTNTSWLPRLSKSIDSSSCTYESTSHRYPRGQQRPTSMASGHQALLLRHRKLVEASKRPPRDRWSYVAPGDFILDDVAYQPTTLNRTSRASSPNNHIRLLEYQSKMQRGCGQEAGLASKAAHQKCQEWLNTWVED